MKEQTIRPTKKQRELLSFIEQFIGQHGYSPSYREIMNGLQYTSVATVSLHVNSLIRRGHLRKRDRSARSLEVVSGVAALTEEPAAKPGIDEGWLIQRVEQYFEYIEQAAQVPAAGIEELATLVGSLRILGLEQHAENFDPRLRELRARAG